MCKKQKVKGNRQKVMSAAKKNKQQVESDDK